ncbi:MAG: immunoglobulin domain-containing protein, partial [Candidatus Hydrogenedentes bacterium]|nr:immunoglobulin domain-containing protein [Candidatus Hydrogenedentota bacterium]
ALQLAYGDHIKIVAITDETADIVTPFVAAQGANMGYTIACDPSVATRLAYGAEWIPQAFIVGTDGRITWQGHSALLDEPIEAAVATLFRFTKQPSDKWLEEGSPLTLEVAIAGGTGPFQYAWHKNRFSIVSLASIYTIEHLTGEDSGTYYCVATDESNEVSITSRTTLLTVFPKGTLPAPHGTGLLLLSTALLLAAWRSLRSRGAIALS